MRKTFCSLIACLLILGLCGGAFAEWDYGISDWERKNELVKELEVRAETGDAEAQALLAEKYINGAGTARDLEKGMEWLIKAADQDHFGAQWMLGQIYYHQTGKNDSLQAVIWLTRAILNPKFSEEPIQRQENIFYFVGLAQGQLAADYEDNMGELLLKADNTFLTAAEEGDLSAQFTLGQIYILSNADNCMAFVWLMRSIFNHKFVEQSQNIQGSILKQANRVKLMLTKEEVQCVQATLQGKLDWDAINRQFSNLR